MLAGYLIGDNCNSDVGGEPDALKGASPVRRGAEGRSQRDATRPTLRLPAEFTAAPADEPRDLGTEADPALEAFFAATGADIRTSDDPRAYYNPVADFIHMPPIATFHSADGYYATLAHETCHWSGHGSRLDRLGRFTDRKSYALEELVAEIGNCMVCASLGLTPDFDQSAAYLASWLRALQDDKRAIFKAASEAQKAADLLLATNPASTARERAA